MVNLKIWFALLLFLPISVLSNADELKPFRTDGCSAFPDGTFEQNHLWLTCCTAHDYAYWKGGTYDQRMAADLELKRCVAEVGELVQVESSTESGGEVAK